MSDPSSSQSFIAAEDARDLFNRDALRKSTAPIAYQVMAVVNGEEVMHSFECKASDRESKMRSLGIHPDNDRWALRNKKDGGWCGPIGTDEDLKQKLRKQR